MESGHALHSKPHTENLLEQILKLRGHTTDLPLLPKVQSGRRLAKMETLLPSYLFAKLDLNAVGLGTPRWIPGLRDVVNGADGPASMDESILVHIQKRLAQKEILRSAAHDRFRPNERIRLNGNAFADLDALCEQYPPGAARAGEHSGSSDIG